MSDDTRWEPHPAVLFKQLARKGLLVVRGEKEYVFRNPVFLAIMKSLAVPTTLANVVHLLSGKFNQDVAQEALSVLVERNLLIKVGGQHTVCTPVSVTVLGTWSDDRLVNALQENGLSLCSRYAYPHVVITDSYIRPEVLVAVDQALAEHGRVLLTRYGRDQIWYGPLLRANESGCIRCLQTRLNMHPVADQTYASPEVVHLSKMSRNHGMSRPFLVC